MTFIFFLLEWQVCYQGQCYCETGYSGTNCSISIRDKVTSSAVSFFFHYPYTAISFWNASMLHAFSANLASNLSVAGMPPNVATWAYSEGAGGSLLSATVFFNTSFSAAAIAAAQTRAGQLNTLNPGASLGAFFAAASSPQQRSGPPQGASAAAPDEFQEEDEIPF